MAQPDPSQYKKLPGKTYGQADGWYYDVTNDQAVLFIADTIRAKIPLSQTTGMAMLSDGTDIEPVAISGGGALAGSGALTVDDVVVGSDAAGDLHYKSAADATARLAKGTAAQLLQMNSGATAPQWSSLSGDATVAAGGALTVANDAITSAKISPLVEKYTSVAVSSGELLAINATPKTLVAAAAGYIHVVRRAVLVLNYNSVAYANNGILGIYETNAAGQVLTGTVTLAEFLAQTADRIKELHPLAHSATTGLTRLDNKAIVLTQATGESINGDSPITVHLWYSTIPHGL